MLAKRRLYSVLAALAAGTLAAGCTKSNQTPAETAPPAEEAAAPAAPAPAADEPTAAGTGSEGTGAQAAAPAEQAAPATPALASLNEPAPTFQLADLDGKQFDLASYRGKTVVLEWFNPGCPFIKYAHAEGPLKDSAKIPGAGKNDVVWLAINSSAQGKQGHGKDINTKARTDWRIGYPILIDENGAVGRMYEAKTTPHMYVIDKDGKLVYRGALDNAPLGEAKGKKVNYVQAALDDLAAGKPVQTAETQPYGCSVKY